MIKHTGCILKLIVFLFRIHCFRSGVMWSQHRMAFLARFSSLHFFPVRLQSPSTPARKYTSVFVLFTRVRRFCQLSQICFTQNCRPFSLFGSYFDFFPCLISMAEAMYIGRAGSVFDWHTPRRMTYVLCFNVNRRPVRFRWGRAHSRTHSQ